MQQQKARNTTQVSVGKVMRECLRFRTYKENKCEFLDTKTKTNITFTLDEGLHGDTITEH